MFSFLLLRVEHWNDFGVSAEKRQIVAASPTAKSNLAAQFVCSLRQNLPETALMFSFPVSVGRGGAQRLFLMWTEGGDRESTWSRSFKTSLGQSWPLLSVNKYPHSEIHLMTEMRELSRAARKNSDIRLMPCSAEVLVGWLQGSLCCHQMKTWFYFKQFSWISLEF